MLTITPQHTPVPGKLPLHHRDPFDRLLISQARLEGWAIVNGDSAFTAYDGPVVW